MKAITLTQPWATLVAIGAKKIETRSWKTNYIGHVAIHAAKGFPKPAQKVCFQDPFKDVLVTQYALISLFKKAWGYHRFPLGAVIATCDLVKCIKIPDQADEYFVYFNGDYNGIIMPPNEPELSFGDYTPGRYAWILANIYRLPEPIPAKGALGLWEWMQP